MTHFQDVSLFKLVDRVENWNPGRDAPGNMLDYIDISSIDRDSKEISGITSVLGKEAPSRARQLVKVHDVLVSTVRPNLNAVALVPTELDRATASTGYCVLRPKNGSLDSRYLFHWVRTPTFVDSLVLQASGASYPAVTDKIVKSSKIPLPPLAEQQRIAAILDKADALRAKRRAALAKLDTLLQATFLDMFGDPIINTKGWPMTTFGEMAQNHDSLRVPVKQSDRANKQGQYPYYGASGIIDYVDDYLFEGERLLIAEDGANLLARVTPIAFLAKGKFWVNNHAHVVGFNGKARLRYLEFALLQIDLQPYVTGSAQPKLNRKNLDRITLACPPINLQDKFLEINNQVERIRCNYLKANKQIENLFNSLQQRAFKGAL